MAGAIWVVGELVDGNLARISAEVATLGRELAAASSREVMGVVVADEPDAAAGDFAAYLPRVMAVRDEALAGRAWATPAATRIAALAAEDEPSYILLGATADGRDVAGVLSALLGWGVLVNATAVTWSAEGPLVEMSVFGGRLETSSAFAADRGLVTVRPNTVTAAPLPGPGTVERREPGIGAALPAVAVVERTAEASAAAPIEEAKIIVTGGRGVGGPEGFGLVEQLAAELGGVVGATRAAVDAGWIPYARQIGQTGKIVKPALYVALGVSGAIQHKVGMQAAEAIVAVNRDPDAPLAEFADLYVVGDLFEVVPEVVARLRSRGG